MNLERVKVLTEEHGVNYFAWGLTADGFLKLPYTKRFLGRPIKNEIMLIEEFSGNVAFKGKVTGKARLVLSSKDLNKVARGDILVATATNPDLLPAMGKAAGFITDQGGITSHASIVARELKKLCIIGTRIATRIIKDGDLVEVDADKGVVKILENN